jgi:hypothetical protein
MSLGAPSLAAFAFAVIVHAAWARSSARINPIAAFCASGLVLGLMLAAWLLRQYGLSIAMAADLSLYAFLCELYIFLFTFVISSLSIEILMQLRPGAKRRTTASAAGSDLTNGRLLALETNGFLVSRNGMPTLTRKGKSAVAAYRALRGFFRHDA